MALGHQLALGLGSEGVVIYPQILPKNLQKKSVALAIFMEITRRFEGLQGTWPYSMASGDSSFSEEDLVSNLLGFYSVINNKDYMTEDQCKPVSKQASLAVWDATGGVSVKKNKDFRPVFHPCDKCKGTPHFPDDLSKHTPAAKGALFRDWSIWDNNISMDIARGELQYE